VIVLISHPGDPHAVCVRDLLIARGLEVLLLDLTDLPRRAHLTLDYREGRLARAIYAPAGAREVDLTTARSVWWRRPQAPDLSYLMSNPDVHAFTHNEWQEATNGLWQLLDVPWMNPPARDEVAGRKALQLKLAAEMGLRIPRTLITSDPQAARAFIDAHGVGRTIFKTFSCTHAIWRETRLVGEAELSLLDHVREAPVIFQEYVRAATDLRVTLVGGKVFPAAIDSQGTDYPVDFRMSLGQARTETAELPPALVDRLLAFMRRLGLVYGAVDLRRTPEGDYVFLEVNTAGEFLFVEQRTGQPISAAVADWLAKPA
jgi:glutathione synthase/RimK-type ligase-like ATP-grasp enzyme